MRRKIYGGKTEFIEFILYSWAFFFFPGVDISASFMKFQPLYHDDSDTIAVFDKKEKGFYC